MELCESKIPNFNLQEVIQYISKKETILYETITTNTNRTPINIYSLYGLDILSILYLQLRYGVRIAELLQSTCSNRIDRYTIVVRGAKHSRHRLIELPYQHPALLHPCYCGRHYLFPYSYKQIWRVYNKLGLTTRPGRSYAYRSVTHTGRVKVINMLNQLHLPQDVIRDVIGHKSINSQNYYLRRSN